NALNAKNKKGETALMIAADTNSTATVKTLLEAGADANLTSAEGKTALAMTGSEEVRSLLISFGAVARSN
ncbi:MAG: ankyrin repeat domain-containing protein, partial [Pyrinomonadaceae bacterium]